MLLLDTDEQRVARLAARRRRRRRRSGAPRGRTPRTARRGRRRRRPDDHRHQLATAAEQPLEHAGRHLEQVVRRPRTKSPSITPRTSPGSQGPAIVIACSRRDGHGAGAGVPGRGGHLHDVLLERAPGLVHGEGGQPLHLGVGGDHRDPDPARSRGRCGQRPRRRRWCRGRWAARSPRRRRRASPPRGSRRWTGGDPGRRGRPSRRPARTARPARRPPRPPPRVRPCAACRPASLAVGLLGEVGDPHPVRPAGLDARLDARRRRRRRARGRSTDRRRRRRPASRRAVRAPSAAAGMRSSSASSRNITSYAGPPGVRSPDGSGVGMACVAERTAVRRRAPTGHGCLGGVEHDAQSPSAGVDDPGVLQRRQLVRRTRQRLARGRRAPPPGRRARPGSRRRPPRGPRPRRRPAPPTGWCPRPAGRPRRSRPRWPGPCPRRRRRRSGPRDGRRPAACTAPRRAGTRSRRSCRGRPAARRG